tara:strand:- start:1790 stop:2212 length:423 start_codon:yes stop_codon:yes gene_type:complete
MTTLTIVKDDSAVSVDGVGLGEIDCTSLASNVHAVQFDGTNGHIEYNDGTETEAITSISAFSTITDAHAAKITANDTATAEAEATQTALEDTYGWKRVNDATTKYATLGDQLDQQYKDAVNDTTTWKDAIAAVKAAHPKP